MGLHFYCRKHLPNPNKLNSFLGDDKSIRHSNNVLIKMSQDLLRFYNHVTKRIKGMW